MLPWTGDVETLKRLIRDPEFDILESPCPTRISWQAKRGNLECLLFSPVLSP
jgi:hypothetical protein